MFTIFFDKIPEKINFLFDCFSVLLYSVDISIHSTCATHTAFMWRNWNNMLLLVEVHSRLFTFTFTTVKHTNFWYQYSQEIRLTSSSSSSSEQYHQPKQRHQQHHILYYIQQPCGQMKKKKQQRNETKKKNESKKERPLDWQDFILHYIALVFVCAC